MMGAAEVYAVYGDYLLDWLPAYFKSHHLLASGRKMKSLFCLCHQPVLWGVGNRWNYGFVHVGCTSARQIPEMKLRHKLKSLGCR